jgi:nitroreductase
MDAMEAILSRRSIRKYSGEAISEATVLDLLKAAMSAPSAHNAQPWHFIIIDDRQTLDKIPQFHPYSAMLREAQLAIAVCGDTQVQPAFWVQDCAAATENILLAAQAKGLGAVWLAVYPREERTQGLINLLGLPDNITPLSIVSLGYPGEKKAPADRYTEAKIHRNHW